MKAGTTPTRRTANCLLDSMNEMYGFLRFTQEIGEDFPDGKLPSLDTAIWVRNGQVLFEFYEKPMATILVVEANSALSEEVKMASLAEVVMRRLRNTSRRVPNATRLEILERACTKMSTSGHTEKFIRKATLKGISMYEDRVRRSELDLSSPQYCPLYQGAGWRRLGRARTKALKKKTWYRDKDNRDVLSVPQSPTKRKKKRFQKGGKGDGLCTTTVVFVPSTKGGLLLRKMIEMEETMSRITGFRIKYQEAGGSKMINLFSQDLGKRLHCDRTPCPP